MTLLYMVMLPALDKFCCMLKVRVRDRFNSSKLELSISASGLLAGKMYAIDAIDMGKF